MREFRTINANEVDEFLQLLCSVFELEFSRAKPVFSSEPFFDITRKWACVEKGRIIACLTTVPIAFGKVRGVGIAGVATHPDFRSKGIGGELLEASVQNETHALLFAKDERLYSRHGFTLIDEITTILLPGADILVEPVQRTRTQVREMYEKWACESDFRLRRDNKRWEYWDWSMKSPYQLGSGYVTVELGRVRELLPTFSPLPFAEPLEWHGLASMAKKLGIPKGRQQPDLFLMGKGFDFVPEMFLTDQF